MWNGFVDRAASILLGPDTLTRPQQDQLRPAPRQRVDAPTQAPSAGDDGKSAEQAIQDQLLAQATPVTAGANAPGWTSGSFINAAQQSAADQAQPPPPQQQRRRQQSKAALSDNALALYREFTARWRAQNAAAQPAVPPNASFPPAVVNPGRAPRTNLPSQPLVTMVAGGTASGSSSVPMAAASTPQMRNPSAQRVGNAPVPASPASVTTAANVAGPATPGRSPRGQIRNPFAQGANTPVPAPPVTTAQPVANTAGTVTPVRTPRRQIRNPFAQGVNIPTPVIPATLPTPAPLPNIAGPAAAAASVAGATGTGTGNGAQTQTQNPLPPASRQGQTRAGLGVPGNAQPKAHEAIDSWINEFLSNRRQQEGATAASGSTAGRGGSRQVVNLRTPAATAAPPRQPPPVTPGNHTALQGGSRSMPPTPPVTSVPSAFPTPVLTNPVPATAPASTPGRQTTRTPLGAPRASPTSGAFPNPAIVTPNPAPNPEPAAVTPATSQSRQLEAPATRRGAISGTPLVSPPPRPSSNFGTQTSGTPAFTPWQFAWNRGGRQSGRGGRIATGRGGHVETQAPTSWPALASALVTPRTIPASSATPTPGFNTSAPALPESGKPPPPELLTPPTRGAGAQQGASASVTNPSTPATPAAQISSGTWPFQPLQQTGGLPAEATPAALPGVLQQTADQQSIASKINTLFGVPNGNEERIWRTTDDLFYEASFERDGIKVPGSSDPQPLPMPMAPSRIDESTIDDALSPSSILRKRDSDTTGTSGDPKRVRFSIR